jgi:hypothetical protein
LFFHGNFEKILILNFCPDNNLCPDNVRDGQLAGHFHQRFVGVEAIGHRRNELFGRVRPVNAEKRSSELNNRFLTLNFFLHFKITFVFFFLSF